MIQPLDRLEWLSGEGPEDQVVFSTRVRLARNLAPHPFPTARNVDSLQQVADQVGPVLEASAKLPYRSVTDLNSLDKALLRERHLISPAFCETQLPAGLGLAESGAISIMVNEEDHLRIQLMGPGLRLYEVWSDADELDRLLDQELSFAFDPQFGFLTSCVSNVGTGLRASAMLHLPGLAWFNALDQIVAQVSQVGLTLRGTFGEGTRPEGNLVQISNQLTLGPRETDIIAKVNGVAQHLVQSELSARAQLLAQYRAQVEDRVWRCYGLLKNARMMESAEALAHLSMVRLGHDLELLPPLEPSVLKRLLVRIRPANLQFETERELGAVERDQVRAGLLRQSMTSLST